MIEVLSISKSYYEAAKRPPSLFITSYCSIRAEIVTIQTTGRKMQTPYERPSPDPPRRPYSRNHHGGGAGELGALLSALAGHAPIDTKAKARMIGNIFHDS